MKTAAGIIGAIMLYGGGLWIYFVGIIVMYGWLDIAGLLIGILVFPIGMFAGLFVCLAVSWWAFISWVIFFGIALLLISLSD